MKKNFFSLMMLGIGLLLMTGCTDATPELETPKEPEKEENGLPINVAISHYNNENTYYLLNDDEPGEVFFNASQRYFYVDEPLQFTVEKDGWFQLRFYSPRALPNVTIWAKLEGYDDEFKLFVFEKIMPFQQFRMQLPFAKEDVMVTTRNGKRIQIMANEHISHENLSFRIECDAPYYKTLKSIKSHCKIWFGRYHANQDIWRWPVRAYHTREAVAIALNMFYMFSSDEFAQALHEYGHLYNNANKTPIDKNEILRRAINHGGLCFGRVSGVLGTGGGNTYGLSEGVYIGHYPDDIGDPHTLFHEFAHCMGYGHDGNMTYENGGTGWTPLCQKLYTQFCLDKKMPVYSRRFMHTRRYAANKYDIPAYSSSAHIIEDPELDELDGGLNRGKEFLPTDWGEKEDAKPLSFTLDYTTAGVEQNNYAPQGLYVHGDSLYVTNDIRNGSFSMDIYDLSTGKPVHKKRIDQWTNPNNNTEAALPKPVEVLYSNGKIYLCGGNGMLLVFDGKTSECIRTFNYNPYPVGLAASDGVVYIYRNWATAFAEHNLSFGPIGHSPSIVSHSENSMTADYDGNIYAIDYHNKRMMQIDPKHLMAFKLELGREIKFAENPRHATWSADGRLFASFANNKFCEMNPKTGEMIKDYTTIGNITLKTPGRCIIRHNTLFIVDRGAKTLYAIPMNELK